MGGRERGANMNRRVWKEGALAASMFVGAKGSSNLPPRAQRRIWAGQIATLEGFARYSSHRPFAQKLEGNYVAPSAKVATAPRDANGESRGPGAPDSLCGSSRKQACTCSHESYYPQYEHLKTFFQTVIDAPNGEA